MSKSVLEAVRQGLWDYEPAELPGNEFDCTDAMPGTNEKLRILAERIECGLPLWHPLDRSDYDEPDRSHRLRQDA